MKSDTESLNRIAGDTDSVELARIRAEYLRRRNEIAPDYYGWQHPVNNFFFTQTARACIRVLTREGLFPLTGRKAADIGCGSGTWLLEFVQWGADPRDLSGIDLDDDRIAQARHRLPSADLRVGSAGDIPWASGTFDVVTQFTVLLSSILDPGLRHRVASELIRIVQPSGLLLSYDMRVPNPSNSNVRPVTAAEYRSLFPGCSIRLTSVTLAPPLARAILPWSLMGGMALETIPLLRTHYLAVIRPSR